MTTPLSATSSSRLARVQDAGRFAADRAVGALDRLIPLARRLGRAVRFFAILVAMAAATILATVIWFGLPTSSAGWLLFAVGTSAVIAPPVVLWVFATVLGDVLELPAKVRNTPGISKVDAAELSSLIRQTRTRGPGERPSSFPVDLWRVGKLLLRSRRDLLGYDVVFRLISVPFLVVVWVAFLVGLVELFLAPALVVFAAVVELVA